MGFCAGLHGELARGVHGEFVGGAWEVHGSCMGGAWGVHGMRMGGSRQWRQGVHAVGGGCGLRITLCDEGGSRRTGASAASAAFVWLATSTAFAATSDSIAISSRLFERGALLHEVTEVP